MRAKDKELLTLFNALNAEQQTLLLEFMRFLGAQGVSLATCEPLVIPRPEEETVIKAIKRLRASYPMLDASKLLHETSNLMTQHAVQGKDAKETIDELEVVFKTHFALYQQKI